MLDTVRFVPTVAPRWSSPVDSTHHRRPFYVNSASIRSVKRDGGRKLSGEDVTDSSSQGEKLSKATLAHPDYRDSRKRIATFDDRTRASGTAADLAFAGFFLEGCTLKCFSCGTTAPLNAASTIEDVTSDHLRRSPLCVHAKSEQIRILMRLSSSERLTSFRGRWSRQVPNENQLAKAGFYIDPEGDGVPECAFCRIKISSWSPTEHPFDTHGRLSPFCAFIVNPPNEALDYDVCGTGSYGQAVPAALGGSRPRYPNLAPPEARMATFDTWRGLVGEEALVEAGFFALKKRDSTKCYHCGIGIMNWEATDVPWEEHARLSPNCELVRLRRAQRTECATSAVRTEQVRQEDDVQLLPPTSGRLGDIQMEKLSISSRPEGLIESQSMTTGQQVGHSISAKVASTSEARPEPLTCIMCLVKRREVLMLPCSHFVTCASCSTALTHCPTCKKRVEQLCKPFLN